MDLLKNWKLWLNIATISFLIYLILLIIAMLVYPEPTGYSFWRNYFSDLGYQNTENGYENPISFILFFLANIFMINVGTILNSLLIEYYRHKEFNKIYLIGPIIAIFSYLILPVIILYKKDLYPVEHQVSAVISFIAGFFSAIYICISFYKLGIGKGSKKFFLSCYIYLFFCLAYGLFPLIYPQIIQSYPFYKPTFQKLSVLSLYYFLIQFGILSKNLYLNFLGK